MTTPTLKLHSSGSLEKKIVIEQRLEKKLDDVINSNNSVNNINEEITYLKERNRKSKQKDKIHEMLTTLLLSIDTFAIIATTSSSVTLSLTGFGVTANPLSAATACGLSNSNKVKKEIIMLKYNTYKKQCQKVNKQLNHSLNYTEEIYKTF